MGTEIIGDIILDLALSKRPFVAPGDPAPTPEPDPTICGKLS